MNEKIKRLTEIIKDSESIVFFGGAGVSTESGIRDYRSEDGIYKSVSKYGVPPERILSRSFFAENPEVFYDFYRTFFMISAAPNGAHKALSRLEEMGKLSALITQNVDGLHEAAGSKNIIGLHGTTKEFFCGSCKKPFCADTAHRIILEGGIPRCAECGGVARPRVVLYEEPLYRGAIERAVEAISGADTLIIGGTSLAVAPANTLIRFFSGKHLVVINRSEIFCDKDAELVIRDKIGETLELAMKELGFYE